MTMDSDGGIRIPLHIDTSQIADDLRAVDTEVAGSGYDGGPTKSRTWQA
jgi:hypothetical protein